jgi:hypothetical protein
MKILNTTMKIGSLIRGLLCLFLISFQIFGQKVKDKQSNSLTPHYQAATSVSLWSNIERLMILNSSTILSELKVECIAVRQTPTLIKLLVEDERGNPVPNASQYRSQTIFRIEKRNFPNL